MNNTLLSVLLACIVLIQCKSIERPESKADSTVNESTLQHSTYTDLRDTLYSYNYVVYNSDTLTMEVVKPIFHKYKDSVSVKKLYRNAVNPREYKGKIKSADELYDPPNSVVSYLYFFVDIAKSGDTEVEAWLLDFYDRYFSYCVKRYKSGIDNYLFYGPASPISHGELKRIRRIFPSINKVNMLAKLYGVQSRAYEHSCLECEVHSAIYKDIFDPNQVMGSIEFRRLYRSDRERANQVFQELLDGIRSGNIKLRPRK